MFFYSRQILISILVLFTATTSSQTLRPNKVALNALRKHIDVESSWLDKNDKEVQQV